MFSEKFCADILLQSLFYRLPPGSEDMLCVLFWIISFLKHGVQQYPSLCYHIAMQLVSYLDFTSLSILYMSTLLLTVPLLMILQPLKSLAAVTLAIHHTQSSLSHRQNNWLFKCKRKPTCIYCTSQFAEDVYYIGYCLRSTI